MTSSIYFAQCNATGAIKVGTSAKVGERIAMLTEWCPNGITVWATIPGDRYRESALHHAFLPYRIRGEWFRSCPQVWQALLEARDTGDLAWLPTRLDDIEQEALWHEACAYFGGGPETLDALAYSRLSAGNFRYGGASATFWGRFRMEQAIRAGTAPSYLRRGAPPVVVIKGRPAAWRAA